MIEECGRTHYKRFAKYNETTAHDSFMKPEPEPGFRAWPGDSYDAA